MNPESHILSAVNWDAFVTLTLPHRLVGAGNARLASTVFAWLRGVAAIQEIHFGRLLWVLRSEHGELGGRLHFHCLLGGLQSRSVRTFFRMKNSWKSITGAISQCRPFDSNLPGVGYVLKGKDTYEGGKFTSAAEFVTVSRSVRESLARGGNRSRG